MPWSLFHHYTTTGNYLWTIIAPSILFPQLMVWPLHFLLSFPVVLHSVTTGPDSLCTLSGHCPPSCPLDSCTYLETHTTATTTGGRRYHCNVCTTLTARCHNTLPYQHMHAHRQKKKALLILILLEHTYIGTTCRLTHITLERKSFMGRCKSLKMFLTSSNTSVLINVLPSLDTPTPHRSDTPTLHPYRSQIRHTHPTPTQSEGHFSCTHSPSS